MSLWEKLANALDARKLGSRGAAFSRDALRIGLDPARARDYFLQLWFVRREGDERLEAECEKAARLMASTQGLGREVESRIATALRKRLR